MFRDTSSPRPGSIDRDVAGTQRRDLVRVDVATPDVVAKLGEAGGANESDPPDADDPYRRLPGHAVRLSARGRKNDNRDQPARRSERATPSISPSDSVWSSVFETQYEPRPVFQPTSLRRSPL